MLHVVGCIVGQHDLRLVGLAIAICAIASFTTFKIIAPARAATGRARLAWVATGGAALGCGVWVTHFVSILAYVSNLPVAFDTRLTVLSLLLAVGGSWAALGLAVRPHRWCAIASGLLVGATIGVMHFTGMMALQLPGVLNYGAGDVLAAWIIGLLLGPLAMLQFRAGRILPASVLLVLAIGGLHFTAMASVSIIPNGLKVDGVATGVLAIAVAAAGLLILLASLGMAMVDQHLSNRAASEASRLRRFADATFEGLFFLRDGVVSDVNEVMCRMLDRRPETIIGARLETFFSTQSKAALSEQCHTASTGIEVELVDASGGTRFVDLLTRPLVEGEQDLVVVAVRDASERKLAEHRIQQLAHTDPLTGLANRLLLNDRLAQALAMAERSGTAVAVLCLDLDRFKVINDSLGHQGGDALLIEAASRIRIACRETETVARLGGDEFIVLQPFAGTAASVQPLAERLVDALAQPYPIDGFLVEATASIGIALYPADASNAAMLLKHADLALYRAKQEGRRAFRFFESAMDSKLRERRSFEQDLRQALLQDEMHLHYQPVFEGSHLALTGYEALLRWAHPSRGDVSPAEFIPVAEESGAILQIGQWVLETACAEAASWPSNLSIAVNLSPVQFASQDLPAQVARILARTGLDPERLELEVTEGVLIDDTDRAMAVLGALKAQGVRIALDDFGTGYSSLSYLRRFPFDRVKIDRSFISDLGVDPNADAIVRCILVMSATLGLNVTAEGIETAEQMTLLRSLNCGHLQGYLLGRPIPLVTRGALVAA